MERFFVNKFPINIPTNTGDVIPIGTIFTIDSISGDFFNLKPIVEIKGLEYDLMFGALMMEHAFTEQEHISNKEEEK